MPTHVALLGGVNNLGGRRVAMLGRRYPAAQFVVTGALGTDSNMHVRDEWLNIECG